MSYSIISLLVGQLAVDHPVRNFFLFDSEGENNTSPIKKPFNKRSRVVAMDSDSDDEDDDMADQAEEKSNEDDMEGVQGRSDVSGSEDDNMPDAPSVKENTQGKGETELRKCST